MNTDSPTLKGTIISAHGRHYFVELTDGLVIMAYPRGKSTKYACGDECVLNVIGSEGRITAIDERSSIFWRSDTFKQKLIAANECTFSQLIIDSLNIENTNDKS